MQMRKVRRGLFAAAFMSAALLSGQHAFIDQAVADRTAAGSKNEKIVVVLKPGAETDLEALKADLNAAQISTSRRPAAVIHALRETARTSKPAVFELIENSGLPHFDPESYRVDNAIRLEASPERIDLPASSEHIAYIAADASVLDPIAPVESAPAARTSGNAEPSLTAIGTDEFWAVGYTGQGRKGMIFDTGVNAGHPALSARFLRNMMPLFHTRDPF